MTCAAGVEVVRRASGSERFLFLLNHQSEAATVPLEFEARDLLTGAVHTDSITLPSYGVAILREPGSMDPSFDRDVTSLCYGACDD